ncbi:hypothetical protein [Haladaptatus pallidirubidus]|uniref:hypothetical protein n=1 Tax=Haladaptatus pallidirubidus TaxID=1008152 RepID=UPI001D0FEE43|nr:hypothetical protein [Haladaptatus pallidirubidus]
MGANGREFDRGSDEERIRRPRASGAAHVRSRDGRCITERVFRSETLDSGNIVAGTETNSESTESVAISNSTTIPAGTNTTVETG